MASLRDLMRLEKRRRANESSQTASNNSIAESTTQEVTTNVNSQIEDENFKNKRVSFADESVVAYVEREDPQVFVEPKIIHEEYYIEDFQSSGPLENDTSNDEEDDQTIGSPKIIIDTENIHIDKLDENLNSESALLAKIKLDKEKWLKIAGMDSFDYTEQDEYTSLIANNIIVKTKPTSSDDINDAIKSKIDQAISKSNSSIVSSNFDTAASISDIKVGAANLPMGFFDDKNLDSQVRGQATKDEAIEKLKDLVKMEKIISSQEIHHTTNTSVDEDLELNNLETNELLESLKKQREHFNPNSNVVKDRKKDISVVLVDDNSELDWRTRNF